MKLTCNVIRDLLPLYVENIASDDTRALVEEHINLCTDCKKQLEEMRMPNELPPDTDATLLKKLKRKLSMKKIQTVILSVMIVLVVVITALAYLTAPNYFPYSDNLISLKENSDGTILATFNDKVAGYYIDHYLPKNGSGYVYSITVWNIPWEQYIIKNSVRSTVLNPNGENITSIYYYTADGTEDVLIYGKDLYAGGGTTSLPRLVLAYYVLLAAALAVICAIILLIFRKNEKIRNIVEKVLFIPLSYLVGHLCIKGFTTSSYSAKRDFFAILLVMFPIYCIFLIANNFYRKSKHKKQYNVDR